MPEAVSSPTHSPHPTAGPEASHAMHHAQVTARRNNFRGAAKITGFFVLVALLAWFVDGVITRGLRQIPTGRFGAMNAVMEGNTNAELVINGSSRALSHFDPRILHDVTGLTAFNLGMNASQIDVQLAVLKSYLQRNAKPEVVIQSLDLFSLETTRRGAIYDPGLFVPYLDEPALYDALLRIDPVVWKWKHIPLYGFGAEDLRFTWVLGLAANLGIYPRETYILGFEPRDVPWTEDFERFHASHPDGVTYIIEPRGSECLEQIAEICAAEQIRLIFVYSPEYSEIQPLEKNRHEIMSKFSAIAQKWNIPFIDYSNWIRAGDRDFFQNSQHLNAKGAEAFTTDLARKLAEIFQ